MAGGLAAYQIQNFDIAPVLNAYRVGEKDRYAEEDRAAEQKRQAALQTDLPAALTGGDQGRQAAGRIAATGGANVDFGLKLLAHVQSLDEQGRAAAAADSQVLSRVYAGRDPATLSPQEFAERQRVAADASSPSARDHVMAMQQADLPHVLQTAAAMPGALEADRAAQEFADKHLQARHGMQVQDQTLAETRRHNQATERTAAATAAARAPGGSADTGAPTPEIAPGVVVPNPYTRLRDPRQRDQFYRQQAKEFDQRQRGFSTERQAANQMINSVDRFVALNKTVGSGGVWGTGGASSIPGVSSVRAATDSTWAEMQSISDLLTPQMRQGLPGAASDRDVAMFRGATVGVGKPQQANEAIALGLKAAAQNKLDYGTFRERWFQSFGHLQGIDNAWQSYLQDNPIFDPNADPVAPKLNAARLPWQKYFKFPQGTGAAASTNDMRNSPADDGPPQDEPTAPDGPPPGFIELP